MTTMLEKVQMTFPFLVNFCFCFLLSFSNKFCMGIQFLLFYLSRKYYYFSENVIKNLLILSDIFEWGAKIFYRQEKPFFSSQLYLHSTMKFFSFKISLGKMSYLGLNEEFIFSLRKKLIKSTNGSWNWWKNINLSSSSNCSRREKDRETQDRQMMFDGPCEINWWPLHQC